MNDDMEDEYKDRAIHSFAKALAKRNEIAAAMGEDSAVYEANAKQQTALHFDPACWNEDKRPLLPAELATLYLMHVRNDLKPDDVIHFLGGISNAKHAWLLTEMMRHINATRELRWEIHGPHTPYDWDPNNQQNFNEQMNRLLTWIRNEAGENDWNFIMTGGFKGVLLALAIKAVRIMDRRNLNAFYLHEGSNIVISLSFNNRPGGLADANL